MLDVSKMVLEGQGEAIFVATKNAFESFIYDKINGFVKSNILKTNKTREAYDTTCVLEIRLKTIREKWLNEIIPEALQKLESRNEKTRFKVKFLHVITTVMNDLKFEAKFKTVSAKTWSHLKDELLTKKEAEAKMLTSIQKFLIEFTQDILQFQIPNDTPIKTVDEKEQSTIGPFVKRIKWLGTEAQFKNLVSNLINKEWIKSDNPDVVSEEEILSYIFKGNNEKRLHFDKYSENCSGNKIDFDNSGYLLGYFFRRLHDKGWILKNKKILSNKEIGKIISNIVLKKSAGTIENGLSAELVDFSQDPFQKIKNRNPKKEDKQPFDELKFNDEKIDFKR